MEATEVGRIVLHALRVERERRTLKMRKSPKIGCEDAKEDMRHKLGELDGLGFLEALKNAAQEIGPGITLGQQEE